MKCFVLLALAVSPAAAVVNLRKTDACAAEDLKRRSWLQNRLKGDCETMCKEVGAYPEKCTCADFSYDKTPGVMTWDELLAHMDNLVAWGGETLKAWTSQASSVLQQKTIAMDNLDAKACAALDLHHRAQVQNKLATACEDMCKEVGAYPKCECPGFAPPDSTPGVMTWEELNDHMDNLVSWGADMLKKAKARAGAFIQNKTKAANTAVAVAKNQTTVKKVGGQPSYGTPTQLCTSFAIFVKKHSGGWVAHSGPPGKANCNKDGGPTYAAIAACGQGTVHADGVMTDCSMASSTLSGSGALDSSCNGNELAGPHHSFYYTC